MVIDKYRTGFKRLGAAIVDWIVFLPLALVGTWISKRTDNFSTLLAWETFVAFAPLIYSIVAHYKYGQTIGKWVTKIKVLDISESRNLSLSQALYRDSFYLLTTATASMYNIYILIRSSDRGFIPDDYSDLTNNTLFWWTLIELITMLTNSKRRAVHDFIAKSVVVRTDVVDLNFFNRQEMHSSDSKVM